MKGWRAAAALVLSACFEAHGEESHRRLREVLYVPGGGSEPWLAGWYDTALEAECAFVEDAAGIDRCMPGGLLAWERAFFGDAGCSEPLLASECEVPGYVTLYRWLPVPACGSPPAPNRVHEPYRVASPVAPARVYRATPDGGCEETDEPGGRLYALLPIDPSTLVMGAIVEPAEMEGRLAQGAYRTEEGAERRFGIFEPGRGRCTIVPTIFDGTGPERVPCMHGPPIHVATWCDPIHGILPECGASDAELAAAVTQDACGRPTEVTLYSVGASLSPADLPEGCASPEGASLVSLEPAPPDAGIWLDDRVRGEGRIRRHFLEHSDVSLAWWPYEDVELGLSCMPWWVGDEVLCLPGRPTSTSGTLVRELALFADPDCSEPARPGGSCHPFLWLAPGCEGVTAVYRATRALDRAYARDATGACVEVDLDPDGDPWALERMPLDAFARFERVLR